VIGRWFGDFLAPHEVPAFRARFQRFLATGEVQTDLEMVQRSGSTIVVHIDGRIGSDEHGQFKQTHCILHNITERQRAEEALRESEERYRLAIEHSSLILAQTDRDLRYTWIRNPHPDFAPDSVLGKRDDELADNEGTRQLMLMKQQVIDTGRGLRKDIVFPVSDGPQTYDVAAEPLRDAAGQVTGVATCALDVTERKRAEEALQRSLQEIARGQRTMLALSRAGQAVQRARTPEEVYHTVGEGLTTIGFQCGILTLSDDRTHLTISHLTHRPALLEKAAKLTGLSPLGYCFPLQPGGILEQCVAKRETIYTERVEEHLAESVPDSLRSLAARLIPLLGVAGSVIAPLTMGDETVAVLLVTRFPPDAPQLAGGRKAGLRPGTGCDRVGACAP
jgi:PAS domain S-box-containing protein